MRAAYSRAKVPAWRESFSASVAKDQNLEVVAEASQLRRRAVPSFAAAIFEQVPCGACTSVVGQ